MTTTTAERLARAKHAGHRDLVGPYANHLERVAALVEGDEAKTVAWLHDIIEDTDTTAADLLAHGFSPTVVDAVRVLTRVRPTTYRDYIKTVVEEGSPVALAVKMADLKDHLREDTLSLLKPEQRRKYEWAMRRLTHLG